MEKPVEVDRAGFEPATTRVQTGEGMDFNGFVEWCLKEEKIRERTVKSYLPTIKKFLRDVGILDPVRAEEWLSKYEHPKTYNDNLIALRKLFKFYGLALHIKQKDARPYGLVIAPSMNEVKVFLEGVDHLGVRLYLALLSTQGIRPERLFKLNWDEVDLKRGWIIPKDGNVRAKFYRPQPIHPSLLEPLLKLNSVGFKRVFNFSESTLRRRMKEARVKSGLKITREDLRKFFYNQARKYMRFEIVEWLMGHQLGVIQHYLADEVMEEYMKFAEAVKPIIETITEK